MAHISKPTDQNGTISVFSFSGFIISADDTHLTPIEFEDEGFRFHFIPPVRIANPTWRPIPQFNQKNLKDLFPNAPDSLQGLSMVTLPAIGADGEPYLKSIWSDKDPALVKDYRDTFVVVILGPNSEDRGTRLAEHHLHRILDWLRIMTKQWWVGKSSEDVSGHLHLQLELRGETIHGHPIMKSNVASSSKGMRQLDNQMWGDAISNTSKKVEAPLDMLMLLDGVHALHSGDRRQGIILLVNAIEIARDTVLPNVRGTDLLKHLTIDFGKALGPRLDTANAILYSFLKSLWVCRGNVAHGKEAVWITDTGKIPLDNITSKYLAENAEALVFWIRDAGKIPA